MSTDEIRAAYNDLNAPSAPKLRAELRKRGVSATLQTLQAFVRRQAERQLLAPRPRGGGKIAAANVNDRWAADLIDYSTTPSPKGKRYALVVQDIFSRRVWGAALDDKQRPTVAKAYRAIARDNGPPKELVTDFGPEFTGPEFKAAAGEATRHVVKDPGHPNATATVDRAIAAIKTGITRAMTARKIKSDWAFVLPQVLEAQNKTAHHHLGGETAPNEVTEDNPDVVFSLRMEAAQDMDKNDALVASKDERLRQQGGFRTAVPRPRLGGRDRAGKPRYTEQVHRVVEVAHGKVKDETGQERPTRAVQPVPETTARTTTAPAMTRPREATDARLKEELQPFKAQIAEYLRSGPKKLHDTAAFMREIGLKIRKDVRYAKSLLLLGFKVALNRGGGTVSLR
jgi:hypothetical protein